MEQSVSSLAFKGSIVEAIAEAKRLKKLFVVYMSGDNPESVQLEKSTWADKKVGESLSKYCILLHISEGSSDAAHFSQIYPQKSAPCITAIGYNGVLLWQNAGFASAEIVASSLEKAWLSIQIQETTATFLSAALSSKKPEQLQSGASDIASCEQESSSRRDAASSSTDKQSHSSEARPFMKSEVIEGKKDCEDAVEDINSKMSIEIPPGSVVNASNSGVIEESTSPIEIEKESLNSMNVHTIKIGTDNTASIVDNGYSGHKENLNVPDHQSTVDRDANVVNANEEGEAKEDKMAESVEVGKADVSDLSTSKSNDVYLHIRMPDGANLQEKFSVMSTLSTVKDYVDGNQASGIGPYDLAIPYPRKVFNVQDLSKTLSELGLFNRQALIVVPHNQAIRHHKEGSSLPGQMDSSSDASSSNGGTEGYFALMKRIFSYVNPFSYLGGGGDTRSSDSAEGSQSNMWQYSPNPTMQNAPRSTGRPYTVYSPNQSTPPMSRNSKSKQPTSSHFGSNIHTLKHDEDDHRFRDQNAFWNGNSTQYGGDNDGT